MRVFLAVFPPPDVQAAALRVSEAMRRPGDGVSWVKLENLHFTMRFLGEVGEDGARRAGEAAREAATASPAFDAALGGPGAFPNARRARVLWLGMASGAPELESLAKRLERALAARGFEPEGRRFTAHLTLGRVRRGEADWTEALAAAGAPVANAPPAAWRVTELRLVKSTLSPRGSAYETLVSAPLADQA
jgi:2'-5' RNA ligase